MFAGLRMQNNDRNVSSVLFCSVLFHTQFVHPMHFCVVNIIRHNGKFDLNINNETTTNT